MAEHSKGYREVCGDVERAQSRSLKDYARIVLPHVALVSVVCLYAMAGAWIFYTLESPYEDQLKKNGIQRIYELRKEFLHLMLHKRGAANDRKLSNEWFRKLNAQLQEFNENMYRAFKEQFVRSRRRSERGEKMWSASSAIFFAATTMSTIGYGNIVPITPYGRVTCVIFALFGAPLAIITIGDLGKFLSECTIWLHRRMRKFSHAISQFFYKWHQNQDDAVSIDSIANSNKLSNELKDIAIDKNEVPVVLVFSILLAYIALGGALFAVLESWTYMDAFYYCFVSLTTIGFGDIVPEHHEYLLLMLIYLGLGLAITTMCIDLAGIQYIQKIHYFGRKFRGKDLMQILRRKHLIERHLAMGQCDEILAIYLRSIQDEGLYNAGVIAENNPINRDKDDQSIWKISSDSAINASSSASQSVRSQGKSSISVLTSICERPNISDNVMLASTPTSSVKSHSTASWLDLEEIARIARMSRHTCSCPPSIKFPLISPGSSEIGLFCLEGLDSYVSTAKSNDNHGSSRTTEHDNNFDVVITIDELIPCKDAHKTLEELPYFETTSTLLPSSVTSISDCSAMALNIDLGAFELVNSDVSPEGLLSNDQPILFMNSIPVHSVHHNTVQTELAMICLIQVKPSMLCYSVPPHIVDENFCFVVDGDQLINIEALCSDHDEWWRQTSRPTKYYHLDDLYGFHKVSCITAKGRIIAAKRASGHGNQHVLQNYRERRRSQVSSEHRQQVPLSEVYKITRFYCFWKTCTAFHRIVTVMEKITNEQSPLPANFKRRLFIQYLWRNVSSGEKARIKFEYDRLST